MQPADNPTRKHLISTTLGFVFILVLPALVYCQGEDPCSDFERTIKTTYNFRPALLSESEREKKSTAMDKVWDTVKSDSRRLVPCLRKALENPQSDLWFRFDGSNLLVSLDPSSASKTLLIRNYVAANLDDVDLRLWVSQLSRLGAEGFDVSEAGERWLSYAKAKYYLPEHGAFRVDKFLGAIFIFGSMEETQATPALLRIAALANHPGREIALSLLLMQATPEAIRSLKSIDQAGLPPKAKAALREHLQSPPLITKRKDPKTSREEFLKAFNAFVNGDRIPFATLVREVPDGERDVVAVLKTEDLPLVRKVRRLMIASANQHAADYYVIFTQILSTLVSQPAQVN